MFSELGLVQMRPNQIIWTGWIDSNADLTSSRTRCKGRKILILVKLLAKWKGWAPESKLFQSHSYAEIPGWANREEPLSQFKLK